MSNWPAGVDAITLFVEDLPVAKQFYQDVFALPVFFEDPNSAVFRFPNVLVNLLNVGDAPELIAPAAPAQPGVRAVYTITVDDVDAICERLAGLGVAMLNGPMDRPWGPRTASFADPAGHIWEIAH